MHRSDSFALILAVTVLAIASGGSAPGASAEEESAATAADGVVAFYFHGNTRCATCKKIEAYADEAVHKGFAEALQNGTLAWRVVNIDEQENRHFIQDFQLVTRSVVLVEYRGDEVVRWKNLDKVWQLVRNKDKFADYVQSETSEFLGGG